jgi:predicted transcriptional regulator
MASVKFRLAEIIQEQPEDATYEEILRELAFNRMVERGLADARNGKVITNEEMGCRIRTWQK